MITPYNPKGDMVKEILGRPVKLRMVIFVHSLTCTERTARMEMERAEWEATWPRYCRSCGGYGTMESGGDWVPYGSGNTRLPSYPEPCSTCGEAGLCPRCGEQVAHDAESSENFFEGEAACPFCGWCWGKNPGDVLPEEPECHCFEMAHGFRDY